MSTSGTLRRASFSRHLAIPVPVGNIIGAALAFQFGCVSFIDSVF